MGGYRSIAVSITLTAALFAADARTGSHGAQSGFISVKAAELKWTDAPSVGPGAKIAVIEGDLKAAEPFTFRLKVPAGTKLGVHTHPTFERVTIISGALYFAIGDKFDPAKAEEYEPGDAFIVPPGVPMYGFTKNQETVLQIHGTGPWGIHYHEEAKGSKKK